MSALAAVLNDVIDPYEEVLAYEYLYAQQGASLKTISSKTVDAGLLPTEVLQTQLFLGEAYGEIEKLIDSKIGSFSVAINNTPQYPAKLGDANERVPLIYYRGDINLVEHRSVSVVGARAASEEGLMRASELAQFLAENSIAVVSGLAQGIDTAALTSCIQNNGRVVAVIGTPIDETYPKENLLLQTSIANKHLLISQVPFYRYSKQTFSSKKVYFRERNVTMAAVSDATVIVEASDTSGSLIQANACIKQGRPLFIMKSCLDNPDITWPKRFIGKGAEALDEPDQLLAVLENDRQ